MEINHFKQSKEYVWSLSKHIRDGEMEEENQGEKRFYITHYSVQILDIRP